MSLLGNLFGRAKSPPIVVPAGMELVPASRPAIQGASAPLKIVHKAGGVPFPFDRVDMLSANPREQLNQPYKHSVWVQRAIKKIAGPIAAVPFETLDAITKQEIIDPLLEAFMQQPAKGVDREEFIEAAIGWLKLKGEAFLIADDTWLLPFQDIVKRGALIMPRPDQMRHLATGGELIGWEYRDPKGGSHLLLPDQVWQIKYWNPYDVWRGMAEFDAAQIAAESDFFAGTYVRNLMANAGDQGPYIVAKNGIPTDEQRAQIIADLREKRARAQRGEFRPVFLTGDIEVQDPKITPPDANLVANRLQNRHEIFIAFGVPASMADVQASYSIGSASDRFQLIEETCIPASAKVGRLLCGPASIIAGREVRIIADWDEHSTMQAVRRERMDTAAKLWATGWSWKSINDYLRLGIAPFAGWDIAYIPISAQAVDASGALVLNPATSSDFAEADGEDEEEAIEAMFIALKRGRRAYKQVTPEPAAANQQLAEHSTAAVIPGDEGFQIFACTFHGAPVSTRARDPQQVQRWRNYMNLRREVLNGYLSRLRRVLMEARREVLASLEARYRPQKSAPKAKAGAAADFLFKVDEFKTQLFAAMRRQASAALNIAGDQLFKEIGRDDPFTMAPEAVLNYARKRETVLAGVPDEVASKIRGSLADGIDAGDTLDQLSDRVRAAFNEINAGRARTIASTETSSAYGAGRSAAMKQAGVRFKAWLTSGNSNVRPAHEQAGLDYPLDRGIPIDEAFIVDEEELMFPGDPDGSPGNVINCHCVSIPVTAPAEEDQ
jgi:phage portal protein BeeE